MDTISNTELRVQETAVSLENCESIRMPGDSYRSYFLQLELLNDILLDLNYAGSNPEILHLVHYSLYAAHRGCCIIRLPSAIFNINVMFL